MDMKQLAMLKALGGGGGGGASSWNDLTDKPFGEVDAVFIEEQTIVFDGGEAATTATALPAIGDTATVEWDGNTYTCQTFDFNGAAAIGNGAAIGLEDTGEPFVVVFVSTAMVFAVDLSGEKASVNLKVSGKTVNKLDPKYVSAATVFYINPDDKTDVYLYSDVGLTTKATAGELRRAVKAGAVIISKDDIEFYSNLDIVTTNQYGVVVHYKLSENGVQSSLGIKNYYTAEYTPE